MTPYFFANGVLDLVLKGTAFTVALPAELALLTEIPERGISTLAGIEVAGSAYVRKPFTVADPTEDLAVSDSGIVFPTPTGGDWGQVQALAVTERSTGTFDYGMGVVAAAGRPMWIAPVCPRTYNDGDAPPIFPIGTVRVTVGRCSLDEDCTPCMMSDYLASTILHDALVAGDISFTGTPYLCLSLDELSCGSTSFTEPDSEDGYARQALSFDNAAFGIIRTSAGVTFPAPSDDWGEIKELVIMDAASDGNILFHWPICSERIAGGDAPFSVPKGRLRIYMG